MKKSLSKTLISLFIILLVTESAAQMQLDEFVPYMPANLSNCLTVDCNLIPNPGFEIVPGPTPIA